MRLFDAWEFLTAYAITLLLDVLWVASGISRYDASCAYFLLIEDLS
jgi:hypothetical protein